MYSVDDDGKEEPFPLRSFILYIIMIVGFVYPVKQSGNL
jgi:hypothetical protein